MVNISNKFLAIVLITTIGLTLYTTSITLTKIGIVESMITGAGTTAYVNVSVTSQAAINFSVGGTPGNLTWGEGVVESGQNFATLDTKGNTTNWNGSSVTRPLTIENIGNKNVNLLLSSSQGSASSFLGGTNPKYNWNFTEELLNQTCQGYYNVSPVFADSSNYLDKAWNTTGSEVNTTKTICSNFTFTSTRDEIHIGFELFVPSDSKTGDLADTITATVTAV